MQLIILGMHRSGTSVLAKLLNMMGAYFGSEDISTGANEENPKGFWERRDVRKLNDFVLHSVGCDWDKVSNFNIDKVPQDIKYKFQQEASKILLEMDSHRPWLLKEPRLCLLFNLWKEVLELPVCVHINRNPIEVAKSLYTRNKIPIHVGIALWEKYNIAALDASRGLPRVIVSHYNLMVDPVSEVNALYKQLTEIGISPLRLPAREEIQEFVEGELYRERVDCKLNLEYLTGFQSKIFDGLTTGKILNSKPKLVVSESSKLILDDYELNIKKDREAKAAQEAAQQQEAELKQQVAQQYDELTQQISQKAEEAKAAQEREAELKQQLAQQYDELTQQISQKVEEARAAQEATQQQEAELRQQLKCQQEELTNQVNKKEQEVKAVQKAAQEKESELRQQLIRQHDEFTSQLNQKEQEALVLQDAVQKYEQQRIRLSLVKKWIIEVESYIGKQEKLLMQVFNAVDVLISSRRWRLGNSLLSLRYKLAFQPHPPMPTDYIQKLKNDYHGIKFKEKPLSNNAIDILDYEFLGKGSSIADDKTRKSPSLNKNSFKEVTINGVSIIILNRNGEKYLKNLLASFLKQNTYPYFEFIIVDHASKDNSINEILKYEDDLRIKVIKKEVNQSFSLSNNEASDLAKYDNLLFLNNDIIFTEDIIKDCLDYLSNTNIAAVGINLSYPPGNDSTISLQHTGIRFRQDVQHEFYRPYNLACKSDQNSEYMPSVTGAFLLCRKSEFYKVGKFDELYYYGYEDVDLCLSFKMKLNKDILVAHNISAIHDESATQKKDDSESIVIRRKNNINRLRMKYGYAIKKAVIDDLVDKAGFWASENYVVGIVVTEDNKNTSAGDYFTAYELSEYLQSELGWTIKFLPRKSDSVDWYDLSHIDLLIVMLDVYDLSKAYNKSPTLVTVSWMRNWFERWAEHEWFKSYDIYLCSSYLSSNYLREKYNIETYTFPIATNHKRFKYDNKSNISKKYCFTGSYWNAKREIESINPENIGFEFLLYGMGWDKHENLSSYSKGFVNYFDLPDIYSNTDIVIDDANHVTKPWASVNSRVFDALASGNLVITNGYKGSKELFNGQLPTYTTHEELEEKITHYLNNPNELRFLVNKLREIVLDKHTYQKRALELKQIIKNYNNSKFRIAIKIPVPNHEVVKHWGDYHFAASLAKQFKVLGHSVRIDIMPDWYCKESFGDDVAVVIRGLSEYKPSPNNINLMWNISHPDKVSIDEYNKYDHVFIASHIYAEKIKNDVKVPVTALLQCTDPEVFYCDKSDASLSYELLFVGNSRKQYRKILSDTISAGCEPAVFGEMWEEIIDRKFIKGQYIDNNILRKYYSTCDYLLNDHWPSMVEHGFISNRIFDAGACGALIITDEPCGIRDVFNDCLIIYDGTPEGILSIIKNTSTQIRNEYSQKIQDIILKKHTFKKRAEVILEHIYNLKAEKCFG